MRTRVLFTIIVAALASGCNKRPDAEPAAPPSSPSASSGHSAAAQPANTAARQLKKSELSEAERRFGIAPVPDATVTYQPDVIIVGGGAAAIRSQDPNGFRWTIDSGAPHARELMPGKVFFMTGRAVGRVLDVRPQGGDLIVTVGPVTLTEIIRDAHIHIVDMPIDLGEAIAYTSTDLPGQVVTAGMRRSKWDVMPATFVSDSGWSLYRVQMPARTSAKPSASGSVGPPAQAPAQGPAPGPGQAPVPTPPPPVPDVSDLLQDKNFTVSPTVSQNGIGISLNTDANGLKVSAESMVHLLTPKLEVHLDIDDGGISRASVELKGAAGLSWVFTAGSKVGMKGNVDVMLTPDTDFSIPVGGIGPVPLAVTVRQRFKLTTALGVRDSVLRAQGDYTFTGGFQVGYFNKAWNVAGPIGFATQQSMTRTGTGISMGVAGLTLANQVRVIAGVGIHGFAAGPYFSFTTAVGAFRTSSIGMLACNGATLDIKLNGGVGYLIPKSIVNLINSVLRALNIQYAITGEGGLEPPEPLTIINKTNQIGGCKPVDDSSAKGHLSGPV
ncbi:MAG TPA: hypothetical protein VN692_13940 [Steroidobacteraceae bacterium]|nr:hypothetical protein [Steroidobacteraceae bacterium]